MREMVKSIYPELGVLKTKGKIVAVFSRALSRLNNPPNIEKQVFYTMTRTPVGLSIICSKAAFAIFGCYRAFLRNLTSG